MIYLVPENNPLYDPDDWRVVVRCTDHPDYSCTFPGKTFEFEVQGLPGNLCPAAWAIQEFQEHMRMSHVELPSMVYS